MTAVGPHTRQALLDLRHGGATTGGGGGNATSNGGGNSNIGSSGGGGDRGGITTDARLRPQALDAVETAAVCLQVDHSPVWAGQRGADCQGDASADGSSCKEQCFAEYVSVAPNVSTGAVLLLQRCTVGHSGSAKAATHLSR